MILLRLLSAWGPVGLWMAIIYRLSSTPPGGHKLPLPDYVLHFAAYSMLGALLFRAAGGARRGFILALLAGSAYGLSDEFHQSFIPGRDPSGLDWLTDTLGSALLPLLLYKLGSWLDRRRAILGWLTALIITLVPAIAIARERAPLSVDRGVIVLLIALPFAAWLLLRRFAAGPRQLATIGAVAASVLLVLHALGRTPQGMLHLYEYGLLGFVFVGMAPRDETPSLFRCASFGSIVALVDEWFQWLWPGRVGEMKDAIEDVVFVLIGCLLASWLRRTSVSPSVSLRVRPHLTEIFSVIPTAVLFVILVHSGHESSAGSSVFARSFGADAASWPPDSLVEKEALAHVQRRNELYDAGHLAEAAAENLIIESHYRQHALKHLYGDAQRATLPAPASPYSSPVPSWIYFCW